MGKQIVSPGAITELNGNVASVNTRISNTCYADRESKTSYTIPLTGFVTGNYWVGLMYFQTGVSYYALYLVFMNTQDTIIFTKIAGSSPITFTGTRNGNVINVTASDTVWGGIRVTTMN